MEHAQRETVKVFENEEFANVLILILMEHAQRAIKKQKHLLKIFQICLNPYFNGTCSKSERAFGQREFGIMS